MKKVESGTRNENAGKLMGLSVATILSAFLAVARARVWLNNRRIQKNHETIVMLSESGPRSVADRAFPI